MHCTKHIFTCTLPVSFGLVCATSSFVTICGVSVCPFILNKYNSQERDIWKCKTICNHKYIFDDSILGIETISICVSSEWMNILYNINELNRSDCTGGINRRQQQQITIIENKIELKRKWWIRINIQFNS